MTDIHETTTFYRTTPIPYGDRVDIGPTRSVYRRSKRALDIVGALVALVLFAPLMLLTYLIVRGDGGPAFFGHMRVGQNGKPFKCWKFRSMVVDAERRLQELLATDDEARAEWQRSFKLKKDPRLTRIGPFLRKSSLDELPQLFNVLRGDMSLVGPRPIVAAEVARYGEHIQAYYALSPGLTGLWQVSGRSDIDYAERVSLDVQYAKTASLALDLVILSKTVGIVLKRNGAY